MSITIRPVPWIVDKAVECLDKFIQENPNPKILEFGSGASTVWFAKKTRNLVSVETDPAWYKDISEILRQEILVSDYHLVKDAEVPYVTAKYSDQLFDIILIDGEERVECARQSIALLKPNGIMMLDNDERAIYKEVHTICNGMEFHSATQHGADQTGWVAPHHWITSWWINK